MEGIKASHLESEVKDEVGATSQAVFWSDEVSGGTFQINQHPPGRWAQKESGRKEYCTAVETDLEWRAWICCGVWW